MGAFLWVLDGVVYGAGKTADEARDRGAAVIIDSTKLVLKEAPESAPFFNVDEAIKRGFSVEYAFVGGTWPLAGVDPTTLLLKTLGVDASTPVPVPVVQPTPPANVPTPTVVHTEPTPGSQAPVQAPIPAPLPPSPIPAPSAPAPTPSLGGGPVETGVPPVPSLLTPVTIAPLPMPVT